ncbi:MAG: hypothetical protein U0074_01200 [Kouleothrix sp.]
MLPVSAVAALASITARPCRIGKNAAMVRVGERTDVNEEGKRSRLGQQFVEGG